MKDVVAKLEEDDMLANEIASAPPKSLESATNR
jgi:hypothetical protein